MWNMLKIVNKGKYKKLIEINNNYSLKNNELKDLIEIISEDHLGISSDKAVDVAIELLKKAYKL
jgi:hypothetical protein